MQVQLSHPATLPAPIPASEAYVPPVSVPYAAAPEAFYGQQSPRAISPVFQLPNPYFTRSPGPGSGTSSPSYPYTSPSIPSSASPPQQYYHPSSPIPPYALPTSPYPQLWSPPPPAAPSLPYYLPNSQQAYFFPPPPVALLPFAYPARPSSAGAGHSHNTNTSPASRLPRGLPGVEAIGPVYPPFDHRQQPDAPLDPHLHSNPEVELLIDRGGEEGKGERASRISHHLRVSARARSMSPTSHRFPTAASALPPTANPLHATSPRHRDGPPVLSPRPLLSPRNSFSVDVAVDDTAQETHGTTRSGRVDLLERMVDLSPEEEAKSVEDVLKDLERAEKGKEVDKTLPKPPVPSGKAKALEKAPNVPQASEVFGLQAPKGSFEKGKEEKPKKSVLRPSPMARKISSHEMNREQASGSHDGGGASLGALTSPEQLFSGLDALEKRLLLEVGTRKPDAPDRPTVFELGFVAPTSAVPRLNSASTHPEIGESEISSLALASNDSANIYPHKTSQGVSSTYEPVHVPRMGGEEKVKVDGAAQAVAVDKNRSPMTPKERLREEKNKEQEAIKLRKAAKGRVANWLGGVAVRPGPDDEADHRRNSRAIGGSSGTEQNAPVRGSSSDKISTNSPTSLPRTPLLKPFDTLIDTKKPGALTDNVPPLLAGPSSPSAGLNSLPKLHKPDALQSRPLSKPAVVTSATSASVPPKVSPPLRKPVPPLEEGTQSVSPKSEEVNGHSAAFPSPLGVPETKYDVRSARGGKGGITTSVAALWTSLAQEEKDHPPKRSTKPVTRKAVTYPAFLDVGKSKAPPAFTEASSTTTSDGTPTPLSPTPQLPQPPNFAKSASVPAAVVHSHARPHLSSTASLARPPETSFPRAKPPLLSSTLSESISVNIPKKVSPAFPRDMAFGQARLKDLIKKYQQPAL